MPDTPHHDDERLDPATLAALLSALPDEAADHGRGQRLRSRVLRRIAALGDGQVTVRADQDSWQPFLDGIDIKVLHEAGGVMAYLLRFAPGASLPAHRHPVDEGCIVLEGSLRIGDQLIVPAGGFHLATAGSLHAPVGSDAGALVYLHGAVPEAADLI